jgi:hypothetical protein
LKNPCAGVAHGFDEVEVCDLWVCCCSYDAHSERL